MKPVAEIPAETCRRLRGVFTDIDDTLTWEGQIVPAAFHALSLLRAAGMRVVPVTGRPGGWVDHFARMWPVDGVVGENGGLWFYMDGGRMIRKFAQQDDERHRNRQRLNDLAQFILARVPGTALASDQPYRDLDLAIDFCEDVPPLGDAEIDRIVDLFRGAGATAKVSSIHVNGWYGQFDKLTGCRRFVVDRWNEELVPEEWVFFGDSANDAPMFGAFPVSIGVANVRRFLPRMEHHPTWVTDGDGGHGFAEAARIILDRR